jgi:hypothetical protein
MKDVPKFNIERDEKARLFVASWDDPAGGGIITQGKDLRELASAIEEAVRPLSFRRSHSAARSRASLRRQSRSAVSVKAAS